MRVPQVNVSSTDDLLVSSRKASPHAASTKWRDMDGKHLLTWSFLEMDGAHGGDSELLVGYHARTLVNNV